MHPFDDSSSRIGEMTLESAADRIALFGSLDIPRSQDGRVVAKALLERIDAIVAVLEAEAARGTLPARATVSAPVVKANPFNS